MGVRVLQEWMLAAFAVLVLTGCNAALFYPDSKHYATPSDFNISYREQTFASRDGMRLSGWWLEPVGKPLGTILVAHGNAQNISSHFRGFAWLVRAGYEIFIFDYRGFGASEGEPDLEGALQDTCAALDHVLDAREGNITVVGQSLGAALLLNAVVRCPSRRIRLAVFDSAFASLPQVGEEALGRSVFTWPLQWSASLVLSDAFDPIDFVGTMTVPKLYLAGSKDGVISPNHSWQLFDASAPPRAFWLVQGVGHIEAFSHPQVQLRFLAFLKQPHFDADASTMLIFDSVQ